MSKTKVLLIGWDAADWDHITPLLDAGKLPNLERMVENGVMGNLATLQPVLSPMLWNSVSTGKQPWKHGILGFAEPLPEQNSARDWSSTSRKTKALWNMLSEKGLKTSVVNWWASHPVERINGCMVSNHISAISGEQKKSGKMPKGSVYPPEFGEELAKLVILPEQITEEQVLPFIPNAAQIDQDNDIRLSYLVRHLAEMFTTHNFATEVVAGTDWDFSAVYYTAIDHFCHSFIQYHPPKLPWISEDDFEMYQQVIAGVYRFSDMMLGRLVELAGPDTTVILCSDHGFQSGSLRLRTTPNEPAGPAYWHRKYGVFLASGPGIKKDSRVYGANLLDIAPTVLSMFDLPVGKDMDGRVLDEIFDPAKEIQTIESWDQNGWDGKPDTLDADETSANSDELLNQFAALGYLEAPSGSKEEILDLAEVESDFNLARNLLFSNQYQESCEIFYRLVQRRAWEGRFILHLANAYLSEGSLRTASALLEAAYDLGATTELNAPVMYARACIGLGEFEQAKEVLERITRRELPLGIALQVAECFFRIRHYDDAQAQLDRILKLHPDNAEATLLMAKIHFRRRHYNESVDAALSSIGLLYNQPKAHVLIGAGLTRLKQYQSAAVAFRKATQMAPKRLPAYRWLIWLYANPLKDLPEAEEMLTAMQQKLRDLKPEKRLSGYFDKQSQLDFGFIPTEKSRLETLNEIRKRPANPSVRSGRTLFVVSGLPRSGTSLMMKMLAAGGLSPKTDKKRGADQDNPDGYFEWEDIMKLPQKPDLLDDAELDHQCIKVVSPLVPFLPYQHHYKVIFMDRDIREVVASQQKMLERNDKQGATMDKRQLMQQLQLHRQIIIQWLQHHPRADVLILNYRDVLQQPQECCSKVIDFIGSEYLPSSDAMPQAVNQDLYRNRSGLGE